MNNLIEYWKPVVGWEGLYAVSSHGRVKSFDRVVRCGYGKTRTSKGHILRGWKHQGYPMVALVNLDRARRTFTHRFVCEAFNGPAPTPKHEVAHNDGDPGNCHSSNLRWATHVENEADKTAHGRKAVGEFHGMAKLTANDVIAIRSLDGRLCDIARAYGVTGAMIARIKKRIAWRHLADVAA